MGFCDFFSFAHLYSPQECRKYMHFMRYCGVFLGTSTSWHKRYRKRCRKSAANGAVVKTPQDFTKYLIWGDFEACISEKIFEIPKSVFCALIGCAYYDASQPWENAPKKKKIWAKTWSCSVRGHKLQICFNKKDIDVFAVFLDFSCLQVHYFSFRYINCNL